MLPRVVQMVADVLLRPPVPWNAECPTRQWDYEKFLSQKRERKAICIGCKLVFEVLGGVGREGGKGGHGKKKTSGGTRLIH